MRNLKKLLAVIVAICVLATMAIPAFAAETKTDAQITEILGVLKGDGAGVTDTYLAKGTNRMQAAQLYLRLIGLEDEALAETATENFDDANLVYAGGQRVLAYLKAHPELPGWQGVGGNKFEPTNDATPQMIYKVMLEALGYKYDVDFTWAGTITFAEGKGLSKIADVATLTNNDLAIAIVEALKAKVNGSDKTLVQKLIDDKIITEANAISAGLIEATPEKLEVVSVSADNQKEVIVVFNKAVDGDTVKADNIKVDGKTATVSLNDDKVTVVIKLDESTLLDNQSEYKVIVEGVKDTSGNEIAKVEKTFKVFDATLPVAEKVTVTGPKNFTITFSEPIKLGGEVEVKSGTSVIGVNSTFTGYEGREIKVELYSSLADGKTYDVTVKGFEDYAGYKNIVKTFELAYAKDASAPTATVEKIDQKYVKIKFNKPVTGLIKEQFYHTFTAWTALGIYNNEEMKPEQAISSTDSVDTVWVKFADSASDKPIGEGKTIIGIRGKADNSGGTSYEIKDNWDNKFESATIEITVTADKTAPEVSELTVDSERALKIKFSEDVVFNNDKVEIFDADGKTIDGVSVSVTGSGKEFKIDLGKELAGKTIIVKIKDVEDKALQPNKMSVYTSNIAITDKSAPEVTKVTVKDSEKALYVFFNEAVDSTAVDKANYAFIKGGKLKLIEKDPAFYDGNKVVKISLKDDEYTALATQDGLFVQRVKDLAGNAMSGQTITTILSHDNVGNMPKVTKIEVTATDKVAVTFDQYLRRVDRGAFAVNGTTVAAMELSTNDDGNTVVTLIPSVKFAANISGATLVVSTGDTYKILNIFDVSAVSGDFNATTGTVKLVDKIAPEITKTGDKYDISAVAGSNVVKVKFNEPIEAAALSRLTFEVKDRTVTSIALNGGDSSIVEITVSGDAFVKDAKLTVTQKFAVVDMAGNEYKLADSVVVTVVVTIAQ